MITEYCSFLLFIEYHLPQKTMKVTNPLGYSEKDTNRVRKTKKNSLQGNHEMIPLSCFF